MRWIRWGLVAVIVASMVGLVGTVVVGTVMSGGNGDDCAVSVASPTEHFEGTVTSRDGAAVTFETTDGRTLVVAYPGSTARFVHPGRSYRVDAWGGTGDLASTLTRYCGVQGGTLHVDGTPINTGFWSDERLAGEWPWMAAGVALAGAATIGMVLRQRRRHPRLTIDGHPLREATDSSTQS